MRAVDNEEAVNQFNNYFINIDNMLSGSIEDKENNALSHK